MKDARTRGMVLQFFYAGGDGPLIRPRPDDFESRLTFEQIFGACEDLDRHGLIDWKAIRRIGGSSFGCGRVTAEGVRVVERASRSLLDILLPSNHGAVLSSPRDVQLPLRQETDIGHHIRQIRHAMDTCGEADAAETRRQLCALLSHPRLA